MQLLILEGLAARPDAVRIDVESGKSLSVRHGHGYDGFGIVGDVVDPVIQLNGLAATCALRFKGLVADIQQASGHHPQYTVPVTVHGPSVIAPVHAFPFRVYRRTVNLIDDLPVIGLAVGACTGIHVEYGTGRGGETGRVAHRECHGVGQGLPVVRYGDGDFEIRIIDSLDLHRIGEAVSRVGGYRALLAGIYDKVVHPDGERAARSRGIAIIDGIFEKLVVRPVGGLLGKVVHAHQLHLLAIRCAHDVEGHRLGLDGAVGVLKVGGQPVHPRLSGMVHGEVQGCVRIDGASQHLLIRLDVVLPLKSDLERLVHIPGNVEGDGNRSGV